MYRLFHNLKTGEFEQVLDFTSREHANNDYFDKFWLYLFGVGFCCWSVYVVLQLISVVFTGEPL